MSIEIGLFEFLHSFAGKSGILDFVFVFLARWLPYGLVVAAIFFIFSRKNAIERLRGLCVIGLTVILSRGIIVEIISALYSRPRPNSFLGFEALISAFTPAFPSGHASAFFALSAAIYFLNKRWGRWFWIFSACVAIARIVVGVHWPTDIIGGFIVGVASFYVVKRILLPFLPREKSEIIADSSLSSKENISENNPPD